MSKIGYQLLIIFIIHSVSFAQNSSVYLDPDAPLDNRVKDLVSKLTLEEKVQQMQNNTPAIPRLNIPAYNWWNESLHGVARSGVATIFPQAIGLGATFDEDLIYRVSTAISDEARATYNVATSKGYHMQYSGLTFWTPNINIFRDPRWGRGQETYGEDPYLTGKLGASFVKGLQGNDPHYLKLSACAKHFAVHSGPERLRHEFNATASQKDLRETYLPAFHELVKAGVESVMCAYNRTNDQVCCASNFLLNDVLRKEWGFQGHVVSDCGAIEDFYKGHKVVSNETNAAVLAVKNGVNLDCGSEYSTLVEAVKRGLISEKEIDASLGQLLKTRFHLGMFDPKERNPYSKLSADVINSDKHRNLAREAALKSIVLLKNNGVLPLKNDLRKYYVTGPNATNIDALIGNYYGINPNCVTIQEGIAAAIAPGSQLGYKPGVVLDRPNVNPIDWTTGEAQSAEVIFPVLGLNVALEGEEGESISSPHFGDRLDYNLPQNQIDFLKKLRKNYTKPIVAIITGGSPMNLSEIHEIADAVLLVWYPGEEGGNAVADILFGKASPSGRLPITFPKSLEQLPAYENYSMKGRTYRYMKAEPMYPFGYGLSYTKLSYGAIKASASTIKKNQTATVEATITNSGNMEVEEVAQLYITDLKASVDVPLYSLKGIKRISLKPGESAQVKFTITPEILAIIDEKGKSLVEAGEFKLYIAGASPSSRSEALGMPKAQEVLLTVK